MGISGLLPFVKKASKNSHIKHFSGCTVAVDAYGWLYKGAFGCAVQIGKGEPTNVYVNYCMKYVNVLLSYGLKPILVLDGRNLPAKALTDGKRRENRTKNKAKAKEALRRGDKKEAWECFTKCIEITPEMARNLIKVLREQKIDYIIAPYEADAQLAYLAKSGIADLVLTEDSDLIVFGCPKIFFKMSLNGDGVFFDQSKLNKCIDLPAEKFHFDRFRQLCILSGCDYLASLPGIGLVRAKRVFSVSTNPNIVKVLKQIPIILKMDLKIPDEYVQQFIEAEQTFLYQLVFDPRTRTLLPLTPYPANVDPADLMFAGNYEHEKLAIDLCLGNVDLHSLQRVDGFCEFDPKKPKYGYPDTSMWSSNFKITKKVNPIVDMKMNTKHTSTTGLLTSVSLAVHGIVKKRLTRTTLKEETEAVKTELTDEEIILKYSIGNGRSAAVTGAKVKRESSTNYKDEDLVDQFSNKTKRRCIASVYEVAKNSSTESETDLENGNGTLTHESEEDDESPIPRKILKTDEVFASPGSTCGRNLRPRIKNPFVKSPEKPKPVPHIFSRLNCNAVPSTSEITRRPVCLIDKNTIYDYNGPNVIVKSQYFRTELSTSFKTSTRTRGASANALH